MISTTESLKALSRNTLSEMDKGNFAILDKICTEDATFDFTGMPPLDVAGFKQVVALFYTAFPDLSHELSDVIAEGEKVVRIGYFLGTHRSEFQGIPASGKHIRVPFTAVDQYRNGKLKTITARPDMMSMMQQLGAIPVPAG